MEPGAIVQAVRRRRGLTQQELAARMGTSQPVVSAYEHGRRDPTIGTLRRMIEAAGEELHVTARSPSTDLPPPTDAAEHGRRLLDVLSVADAIPQRPRSARLQAPRLVSS